MPKWDNNKKILFTFVAMKIRITKHDILLLGIQIVVWLVLILVPAITTFFSTHNWIDTWHALNLAIRITMLPAGVYFLNYCVIVPLCYYRGRRWLFFLINALIVGAIAWHYFLTDPQVIMDAQPNEQFKKVALIGYYASTVFFLFVYIALACLALLVHHVNRTREIKRQLKEEQHKRTEAELEWLKNQLNPHFLFNTLNNISSLIQIDADLAQDSIAQLSDLLRYAMYETRNERVPLKGEIEFMQNYIDLMKLRCNERTVVHSHFSSLNSQLTIAPLLFISLIENAFKHGVSSNRDSSVEISLTTDDHLLTFVCKNTNYPKDEQNRSGSGIGVENTKRRLELIYQDRYTWEQETIDNIYQVKITIQL